MVISMKFLLRIPEGLVKTCGKLESRVLGDDIGVSAKSAECLLPLGLDGFSVS